MAGKDGKFKKGEVNNPGGRPKGAKGKFTHFKDSCIEVYESMGGDAQMKKWAKDNQTEFYKMMKQMLPKEISVEIPKPIKFIHKVQRVKPDRAKNTD